MRAVDDKCDRQRARIAVELCLPIRCWWSCLVWRRRRPPSCEHAGVRAVSTTLLAAVTCSAREKRASTLHRIGPPCSSHSRVRMSVVCVRRETVGSVVTIARGGDSGLEPAAGSHACSFTRTAASGALRCAFRESLAVCGRVCFSLKTMQRQTAKQQRKWVQLLMVFYWGEVYPLLLLLGR